MGVAWLSSTEHVTEPDDVQARLEFMADATCAADARRDPEMPRAQQ